MGQGAAWGRARCTCCVLLTGVVCCSVHAQLRKGKSACATRLLLSRRCAPPVLHVFCCGAQGGRRLRQVSQNVMSH